MFALFALIVLASPLTGARAEDEAKRVQDCMFFSSRMVMSTSSGALGHIVSGNLEKGKCYYDVRLHLAGQLLVVKGMRDYELAWAPEERKEEAAVEVKDPDPEEYVEHLDFGS
jgi:hypothetical protein